MDKNRLTLEEVKKIQLEILHEFHDFCMKNGLKYSLCAGTLLGAIRHKGYIPWDDDVDVMMPRRDYQLMLELFSSETTNLYHYSKQKSYVFPYAKLCDKRTIVKEGLRFESDFGVDIDIFPLDFYPDSLEESMKWARKLGFFKVVRDTKNLKLKKSRSFKKNATLLLMHILTSPIPMRWLARKIDLLAQKYTDKGGGYWGNLNIGYRINGRSPMADGMIDVEFEGSKFKAIDNYDTYLKDVYGDYMQLPPVELRKSTHTYQAWWKKKEIKLS